MVVAAAPAMQEPRLRDGRKVRADQDATTSTRYLEFAGTRDSALVGAGLACAAAADVQGA